MAVRTMHKAFPLLVMCLLLAASVLCLGHSEDGHAVPEVHATHQHGDDASSAPHASSHASCLVATLPSRIGLVWCFVGSLYPLARVAMPVVPTFPPLIPPKIV
ncbi:MAG: hypothetical protein FJZ47_17575 [Candidatus Tectomicrobia bacterium]|uniref:Secreted protein n=1 Tax=Tectimicrobiota bacterium TaxID=2528274 RepID=A0A937W4I3_UNCTE|nr:hypothetical protein [Candidatus Tectomicrobia bacterium]